MNVTTQENVYDPEGRLLKSTTKNWDEPDPTPDTPPGPGAPQVPAS